MLQKRPRGLAAVPLVVGLTFAFFSTLGCVSNSDHKGVRNVWRAPDFPGFTAGETTQKDVLELLGPPSQLIALDEFTVFYYLHEVAESRGYLLLIYNRMTKDVQFDRAIFFFNKAGVLTEFSLSEEEISYDPS